MASAAIVDAGPLVAVFGARQPLAGRYRSLFKQAADQQWSLATTWPCIVEASHLLGVPQRYSMLRWVGGGGINVYPFNPSALDEMVASMMQYTEPPPTEMDLADASLLWLASDTGVTRLMTMDLRDFARYRLPDGRAFDIL